jgi:hypothetical protein
MCEDDVAVEECTDGTSVQRAEGGCGVLARLCWRWWGRQLGTGGLRQGRCRGEFDRKKGGGWDSRRHRESGCGHVENDRARGWMDGGCGLRSSVYESRADSLMSESIFGLAWKKRQQGCP